MGDNIVVASALSNQEKNALTRCERTIEKGIGTFRDVGAALLEIRESRLYRREADTFADYCKEKWGFNDSRARQLIAAAKTAETVEISTPLNEGQAKALTSVPEEKRQAVVDTAIEQSDGKPLTAAAIRKAAEVVLDDEPDEDVSPPAPGCDWLSAAVEELCEATGNTILVADFLDGIWDMMQKDVPVCMARLENKSTELRANQ